MVAGLIFSVHAVRDTTGIRVARRVVGLGIVNGSRFGRRYIKGPACPVLLLLYTSLGWNFSMILRLFSNWIRVNTEFHRFAEKLRRRGELGNEDTEIET